MKLVHIPLRRKQVKTGLAVLLLAIVRLTAWEGLRTHEQEPIYCDKPLGYWMGLVRFGVSAAVIWVDEQQ